MVDLPLFKLDMTFEVVCVPIILFKKPDLINAPKRVYSRQIGQLSLTQNTESRQVKKRERTSEKLKFGCMFDKVKTFTNVKSVLVTA